MTLKKPLANYSGNLNELNTADQLDSDIAGNAATATILETARTIAGTSFDGSANIDIDHDNLAGKDLANTGVTYGHIDDQIQTIAGVKTFSSFPVSPSSAPTADYQFANKKYVDDNAGGGGGGLLYAVALGGM